MAFAEEVIVLLNYVKSRTGRESTKGITVLFSEVPEEIRHLDIAHLIEECEGYGYLSRLPTFMSDSAIVQLTKKGFDFIRSQSMTP